MKRVLGPLVFLLALASAGCYSTTTTENAFAIVRTLARVEIVAIQDEIPAGAVDQFRTDHEKIGDCVLDDDIVEAYWADELHLDQVVLRPKGKKAYEVIKVQEIGTARVMEVEGERNGKPFKRVEIDGSR